MFVSQVETLLDLLRIFERSPLVFGIGTLLLTQVYLLLMLLLYVAYRRVSRMISRWRNEVRYLNHLREIFAYVYTQGQYPIQIPWYERNFYRRLILSQMTVMDGKDFQTLQQLYREWGYYSEDLRALKSKLWWRRLAALIRLETCELPESRDRLAQLIEDPNDFVALVALRALSPMSHPDQIVDILDALSRRAPSRRDLYVEILQALGEESADVIIKYLRDCFDPQIASICIDVLGSMKATSALPILRELAKSSESNVVEACARAFGLIGNPEAIETLRNLIQHESGAIRAESLRSLALLKDPRLSWAIQRLKLDQNPEVLRTLFEIEPEGELA